eukprot:14629376-Alexandrium_andersonii.AAC.1
MQAHASPCKPMLVHASSCKPMQASACPCKTLPCKPLQALVRPGNRWQATCHLRPGQLKAW